MRMPEQAATPWTMPHVEAPVAILTANGRRVGTFSIPQDAAPDEKADCLATMYGVLRAFAFADTE